MMSGNRAELSEEGRIIWLRCLHCGHRLKKIHIRDGWTCLTINDIVIRKAEVPCKCGAKREFHSDPTSAVRLSLM